MAEYAVIDPTTSKTVARYPTIGEEALSQALEDASHTHEEWSRRTTVAQRSQLVRDVGRLHRNRREELAVIITREIGKPIAQSLKEVDFTADIYEYYADNGENLLADEPITLLAGEGYAFVRSQSVGPLLGIMPWNYPYYQVARFAAPNLVAGNTIVLKHAPQCPESSAALQQLYIDAGFPAGAYSNIYATNDQISRVIADRRIQGVSFTGSERAGAAVAEIAGRNLKKVVLELGGSDPFVLLSTDDLDATVEAAVAGRIDNNGQACNAAKRFIIIDELYDAFVERFVASMRAIVPGSPSLADTVLGPLSSQAATDHLQAQVSKAVANGARVLAGGERRGNFFSPTVLTDMSSDNPGYREEFFGPVATVFRAGSEAEALELANDTPFGLGSYVFTTDPAQALRVADGIEAGMVFINTVGADGAELPFGGTKRSGFGRELGNYGIGEFVNRKLIRVGL